VKIKEISDLFWQNLLEIWRIKIKKRDTQIRERDKYFLKGIIKVNGI